MLRALQSSSSVLSECVLKPALWTLTATRGLAVRALTEGFTRRWDSETRTLNAGAEIPPSQLDDLPPTMLKKDYAESPLINTTDDLARRLLSLEFASHRDKLRLKEEQLIAKVRRNEHDHSSTEVKVALLTARIRNYQEHLQMHPKDKANKRRMLMAIDRRKKHLKYLRRTRHDIFESVCQKLDITYSLPPPYYRRLTRRWRVKKALCTKVFEEVQKRKAKERERLRKATLIAAAEPEKSQGTTV
ncbi:28S ribosomal protein S15, mitochondrial-like [Arapaima gigas]